MSMLKKVKMVAFGLLGAVMFFAAGNNVLALTPDGEPPSVETVCDELSGAAFGLCNAYCEAMDCENAEVNANIEACNTIKDKLLAKHEVDVSGGCAFNGDAVCPCDVATFKAGLEQQFGDDLFESNCNPDSSNSDDADITWVDLGAVDTTLAVGTYSISDFKCTLDGTALPADPEVLTPEEAADCVNKAGAICDECEPPPPPPEPEPEAECPCVTDGLWAGIGALPPVDCQSQYGGGLNTMVRCNINITGVGGLCRMFDGARRYNLAFQTGSSTFLDACTIEGGPDDFRLINAAESLKCADILDLFCF